MLLALLITFLFFAAFGVANAHCPLCTAGAGIAAVIASQLGVEYISIGLFIGGFSVALGSWMSKLVKYKFRYKKEAIMLASFLLTVLPIMKLMPDYFSFYLNLTGEYGSLLNRTYIINKFLVGSIVGGLIVFGAPFISKKIKKIRGKLWPYQGLSITFGSLILLSILFELWM